MQEYLGFINAVGEAILGKRIRDAGVTMSPTTERVMQMLSKLSSWVDEIPLNEQEQRFGNKAYREWHKRLVEVSIPSFLPQSQTSTG